MKKALLASSIILSLTLLSGCGYNEIQSMDEEVNNQWAQVETQLQRRSDLIPNLVKVVQSYAKHEHSVFKDIADARSKLGGAISTNNPEEVAKASNQFSGALGRLLVVAEKYPELKANEQYTRLMDELAGTENRIAVARKDYNDTVRNYNGYIRQLPQSITASFSHAEPRKYYNPPEESQKAPEIKMD